MPKKTKENIEKEKLEKQDSEEKSEDKKEIEESSDNKKEKNIEAENSDDLTKKQINQENKILKNIFIGVGIFVLVFVLVIIFINSSKQFEYHGVEFKAIKQGDIIFYNTVFPMYSSTTGEHTVDYNVYLRKDPRKLKDISFDGEINLKELLIINETENFNCDGDGIVAIGNFVQVLKTFGTNVRKDPNATCDSQGRYTFVQMQEGDETGIEQTGPSCYTINIHDCEILEALEKFMLETFVKFKNN